ncbi:MAG: hypothetical protein ABWZ85_13765 [Luteibacter sp.]
MMKFKRAFSSVALAVTMLASGIAFSYDNLSPEKAPASATVTAQGAIDEARAPIKSEADLQKYLVSEQATSPMNRLSPAAKAKFLSSLRFGDKALGSYNYEALESELTASQIYDILSLFGAQATTQLIPGAIVRTETDSLIMKPQAINRPCGPGIESCDSGGGTGDTDYAGYGCGRPHTCIIEPNAICMHSC